jgi:glycosyltransferase involved in cell wall biosynthesis
VRTLISHEWLSLDGGSENVFEQMIQALPGSDLQCLWNDAPDRFDSEIAETWLARTRLRANKALALPFMSRAWRSIDLEPYDRVVTSSHAFCHQLAYRAAAAGKAAYAYVHTPARYVWSPEMDERGAGLMVRTAAHALKAQDRRFTTPEVSYAANSEFVRERIGKAWDVDARVIYPPVAVARVQSVEDWSTRLTGREAALAAALPDAFVLGASRMIEYKRLDLAMTMGEALGLPVVIAGDGPHYGALKEKAAEVSVPVTFTGRVSDPLLYTLYQKASVYAFMPIEDFGIMPVEAMALGTPVVVNRIGGASESAKIIGGGETAESDAAGDLKRAAEQAMLLDTVAMSTAARQFDEATFREAIATWTRP